jgi:hypothetical protein
MLAANSYEWVLEADFEACFDLLSHTAILVRMRRRVGDKRVMMPGRPEPKTQALLALSGERRAPATRRRLPRRDFSTRSNFFRCVVSAF